MIALNAGNRVLAKELNDTDNTEARQTASTASRFPASSACLTLKSGVFDPSRKMKRINREANAGERTGLSTAYFGPSLFEKFRYGERSQLSLGAAPLD
jgi:hypothetical protein